MIVARRYADLRIVAPARGQDRPTQAALNALRVFCSGLPAPRTVSDCMILISFSNRFAGDLISLFNSLGQDHADPL
jgi:hypothetical protein